MSQRPIAQSANPTGKVVEISPIREDVQHAVERLRSLHDEGGVAAAAAAGTRAIPALRALLFEREPSGLYQPRCRAVQALALLGAFDVLRQFLDQVRFPTDPVERTGEEAVVNAAARVLAKTHDGRVFAILQALGQSNPHMIGVIEALGAFGRGEAIPQLVAALAEDCSRTTAEAAIERFGRRALAALLDVAARKPSSGQTESPSALRQRRSVCRLLSTLGVPGAAWPRLRPLMWDYDDQICVTACKICLADGPSREHESAKRRLTELLPRANWMLAGEILEILSTAGESG
jgi:HEAT repeat protein